MMANFIGLKLARDWASDDRAQHDGLRDRCAVYVSDQRHVSVDKAVDAIGLGREALHVWEDFLERAQSLSLNERPILTKIRQRIARLRAQLTPQDRGVTVAPVSSRTPSSVPQNIY